MKEFNSKQYAWCDISVALGGRIIEGCTAIEYTEKKEKEYVYGRGNKPHSIARGNSSFDGKLSIWQTELEKMVTGAKDNDILNLSFDVVISYVPQGEGKIVTDILKGAEFTEVKKGMSQGDKNMVVELPIVFLDVKKQQ